MNKFKQFLTATIISIFAFTSFVLASIGGSGLEQPIWCLDGAGNIKPCNSLWGVVLPVGGQADGDFIVDVDGTEAFQVRKDGDLGNVFTVDTINSEIEVHGGDIIDVDVIKGVTDEDLDIISLGTGELILTSGDDLRLIDASNEITVENLTAVTKTLYVDGNRTDTYTANGHTTKPYKLIQNAINASSAGTVIIIASGTYNENITLTPSVHLVSTFNNSFYTTVITGKITYAGSGSVMLSGIYVLNTTDHALEFTGTNAQKLRAYNCKFETNSIGVHHAILATNTNASSELHLLDSLAQVQDSSGGAKCIVTNATSAGEIGLDRTTVRVVDNDDNIAIDLDGAVSFWHGVEEIRGTISVATTASCIISMASLYSSTQPNITTNSAGNTVISNTILSTTASPAVTGAGAFAYSSVGYMASGTGFASTLNGGLGASVGAIAVESAYNSIYDNTVSGLTATKVQTAIDELTGLALNATWVGVTTLTYDGDGLTGYHGVGSTDAQCATDTADANARVCTNEEIVALIQQGSTFGGLTDEVWCNGGAPSYTANANDCKAWTEDATGYYGRYWKLADKAGWLSGCASAKKFACCK